MVLMAKQLTWDSYASVPEEAPGKCGVAIAVTPTPAPAAEVTLQAPSLILIPREPELPKRLEPAVDVTFIQVPENVLPSITQHAEFASFQSSHCEESLCKPALGNVPFAIKDNPNANLWERVLNKSPEEVRSQRAWVLSSYKPLGLTSKIEGDRGLIDSHRRREANYGQFFTPWQITKFIAEALGLSDSNEYISLSRITQAKPVVVDNSAGIGRMFEYLSPYCRVIGIEVEDQAYHMAARLFPEAHIIQDSLVNHTNIQGDYFLINPPFSIQLEKKDMGLENAKWGPLGPSTSVQSHIAALEIAIKNARKYVAAVVPSSFYSNEDTRVFEKWINRKAELVMRIDLPPEAFKSVGTEWPCTIAIYHTEYSPTGSREPFVRKAATLEELETIVAEWKMTSFYSDAMDELYALSQYPSDYIMPEIWNPPAAVQAGPVTLPSSTYSPSVVHVSMSPDSSGLSVRPTTILEALKVKHYMDSLGKHWVDGLRDHVQEFTIRFRRKNILSYSSVIEDLRRDLETMGLPVVVDPQIDKWIRRKQRWLRRQLTPFEQYIKKDGEWICLNELGGIRSEYSGLYKLREKQLCKLGIHEWLWPFQKDDVIRMSLKNTNLLCWSMGLGKARGIVATALLYGCKHNLIVVEPKLKHEFTKELKALGIEDYQIIETADDLRHLKKFNLIAYNKLWKPLHEHTKKTFAKAMRRRFQFIAIDEAHKIKAKDSEQAKAVRMLKSRYKLLSTGTPIANYPRNIFSLLVFGWGDGTELNQYGYYAPVSNGYGYTTGTRQFKEDFISIEWVTPQFDQTLDSGAKAREMPKIKDTEKWWAMMSPKIIRRQRDEPEVAPNIVIPKPEISTELIKMSPEQVIHYKRWLDEFASWFKEQLRMEKEEGHKIDQMVVLAHLTQLQFASTIPQSKKTNNERIAWPGGITTKQRRVMDIIEEAQANQEKIIVFSERPDFQLFIRDELRKRNIKSHVFIGSQGIKTRNVLLDDFKNNGTHVLLATTTCGETGLNIPEANVVVIADTSWTPSKQIQAYSRILRPQQKKQPRIYLLRAKGTIDEYMQQLMNAKSEAIDEGIDYQEASEFDPAKWLSYRDFTIKMLKEEGYDMS
jgi:hypothetical protein